jgi:hypothetical protein
VAFVIALAILLGIDLVKHGIIGFAEAIIDTSLAMLFACIFDESYRNRVRQNAG